MLHITMTLPPHPAALGAVLEGMTGLNYQWMRAARRDVPNLYRSGVRYRKEPDGQDQWLTASQLLSKGYGDCEDVACYQAAYYRAHGEPAIVKVVRTRRGKFHAIVQRGNGVLEDPSRILLALERREHHG